MSEFEEETRIQSPVEPLEEEGPPAQPVIQTDEPSIVDLLRQDYKELTDSEEVYIPVAGYERAGLQVKYRLPESGRELADISRRVFREYKETYQRNLYIAMDTIIVLCEGLYVEPEFEVSVNGKLELDPDPCVGEACRFDDRLALAFGWNPDEIGSARKVLRKLFGGNDMAILGHAEKLNRWMANTKTDLSREFWQSGE